MKSLFGGSAVIAASILASCFLLSARPSAAETPVSTPQQPQAATQTKQSQATAVLADEKDAQSATSKSASTEVNETASAGTVKVTDVKLSAGPFTSYTATAYSLYGRTASGRQVSKGLIAADPRVLPLGTRVRIDAGAYSGEYLVADTGGMVRGKRIDIWTPTSREAMRFGRRTVKLTVLSYPSRAARKQRAN